MTEDPKHDQRWPESSKSGDQPSGADDEIRLPDVVHTGKEIEASRRGRMTGNGGGDSTAVVVPRRTLTILVVIVLALALAVAGLLYATLAHKGKAVVAAPTGATSSSTPAGQEVAARSSSSPEATTPTATSSSQDGSATTPPPSTVSSTSAPTPSTSAPVPVAPITGPSYLGVPVDGNGYSGLAVGQDVQISQIDYPQSVDFYCPENGVDWNVAGSSSFTATFGIVDGAENAVGAIATIKFTDENNRILKVVKTQLGQPQRIAFPLKGVQRLVMECTRDGGSGYNTHVGLGDAATSK